MWNIEAVTKGVVGGGGDGGGQGVRGGGVNGGGVGERHGRIWGDIGQWIAMEAKGEIYRKKGLWEREIEIDSE